VIVLVCTAVMVHYPNPAAPFRPLVLLSYPLAMAALLLVYGWLLDRRFCLGAAGVILAGWLTLAGWRGYCWLRQVVLGLDHLLLSLALFAVTVLISLAKSGARPRWWAGRTTADAVLLGSAASGLSAEAVQAERNEVQEKPEAP
jgi:hypothetical protein